MSKFDNNTYPEEHSPAMASAVPYDPEHGNAEERSKTRAKEPGCSNMAILIFILAVAAIGAVAFVVVRGRGSNDDTNSTVPSEAVANASPFDFAPDATVLGCTFDDFVVVENADGEERLKLRAIVNEEAATVSIQAERTGEGWIGISINNNEGMVPNTAVIGTPADGLAEMYFLGGKSRGAIENAAIQSISSGETLQDGDRTILSFTVGLDAFEDATVVPGESTKIMWAVGNEGDTDFSSPHAFNSRGFRSVDIASCNADNDGGAVVSVVAAAPFDFAPAAPLAECGFEQDFVVVENADGEERLKFRAIVNERDETVSIQAERDGEGWIGISINDSEGMVPNVAAIGTPSDGKVEKYNLGAKSRSGVTLLEANEQTLSSTQTIQQDGRTLISFTMPLSDTGSSTIVSPGSTRIMWAIGAAGDDTFSGAHAFDSRGFTTIDLPSCGLARVTPSPTSEPTSSPVQAPVVDEEEEEESTLVFDFADGAGGDNVVLFQEDAKVYAKTGNRRSCQADVCPGTWWDLSQNDCTCNSDGLNSCYEEGYPVSLEAYYGITYTETWTGSGKYTMSATGTQTEFGAGGDHASADACYDSWQRGGFKIDLAGTSWAFHADSTIWVDGYSPSMKIWADNQVVELHEYNQDATMSWKIPQGTRRLEVVCGGWPGNCWSELAAYKP